MNRKLRFFRIIIVISLLILMGRACYLQLVKGDYYYQLSEGNRISLRPINAPRGKIYSSAGSAQESEENNNRTLVSNRLSYDLYLLPNEISQDISVEEVLKKIASLITLEDVYQKEAGKPSLPEDKVDIETDNITQNDNDFDILKNNYLERKNEKQPLSYPVRLKRNISPENMLIIEENRDKLSGVLVEESTTRNYVYGDFAVHVLAGLENNYTRNNGYLLGEEGFEQIEINSLGEKIRTLGIKSPEAGCNLITTLDFELQNEAEQILENEINKLQQELDKESKNNNHYIAGSIVVLDPHSGRVLSMASYPDYDLDLLAGGMPPEDFQKLISNPGKPFFDRAIMATEPPGSVFKLITAAAAVDTLDVTADTLFHDDDGEYRGFRNWKPYGEGEVTLTDAIASSNNAVFFEIGDMLFQEYGGEKFVKYAHKFGLGHKTGIDLASEKAGHVPESEDIKYYGEAFNITIGQGPLEVTPLQLTQAVSIIANRGTMYKPYIIDDVICSVTGEIVGKYEKNHEPEIINKLDISQEVYEALVAGMVKAAHATKGTASGVFRNFPSIKVAGKTGTAQTAGLNDGWFAGFAPAEEPEIAFTIFLENGQSSSNTLPIAAELLKSYFDLREEELEDLKMKDEDNDVSKIPEQLSDYLDGLFADN